MSIKDPDELGHWKHPGDEVSFRQLVDELSAEYWTTPLRSMTVTTSYGEATVHQVGGTGLPVVLLPGYGAPALMYRPELVAALGRPTYLVETIGDVGPSVQTAPIRDAADEAAWVGQVLDELVDGPVHLAGTSFGGWLALNLARRQPKHVRSVIAIEPVWARLGLSAALRGLPVLLAAAAPSAVRERAARRYHQPLLADPRLRKLGRLAFTRHVNGHPRPDFLTDGQIIELAGHGTPTLFVLGAESEITKPDVVTRRLDRCLPRAEVEVVEDAGHSVAVEHPELVGRRLASFLDAHDDDRSRPTV